MKFSHEDIKLFIYGGSGLGGVFMLILAAILYFRSRYSDNPIEYALPCVILFVSGLVCLLFAVETFIFRDERDSWN